MDVGLTTSNYNKFVKQQRPIKTNVKMKKLLRAILDEVRWLRMNEQYKNSVQQKDGGDDAPPPFPPPKNDPD